ncbi:hypothetical protein SAMN04488029_0609 [Reichenbachiella faecimaris]|uniref:Uncharacterized protein n=1 Tax=Reichenbachiella faecimaris TaxID=692418 RepID=A0A1W2G7J6_REIFA|nr:hypothetical protein [Reichenbachiella faecimaris]SMD32266.1 hypothetical protein SAMN04488029_0609 [Reichenbachiella faecimaris]
MKHKIIKQFSNYIHILNLKEYISRQVIRYALYKKLLISQAADGEKYLYYVKRLNSDLGQPSLSVPKPQTIISNLIGKSDGNKTS